MGPRHLASAALAFVILLSLLAIPTQAEEVPMARLGLGFGPGNIRPIDQGVPIYAPGDEMWVESYYNTSLSITIEDPSGAEVSGPIALPSGQPVKAFTFGPSARPGDWLLLADGGNTTVRFTMVSQEATLIPHLESTSLSGPLLIQNFVLANPDAYYVQVCSVGSRSIEPIVIQVPSTDGGGNLTLDIGNSSAQISGFAGNLPSFVFWAELHYNYSYSMGGVVLATDIEASRTVPVTLPASVGSMVIAPLVNEVHLRQGRYTLLTYFSGQSGLDVESKQLLLLGRGSWMALDMCTSTTSVGGPTFAMSSSLDQPTSNWPRGVYVMFRHDGVESWNYVAVPSQVSALTVLGLPWNKTLGAVTLTATGSEIVTSSYVGDVLYLILGNYPANVTVNISFSGIGNASLQRIVQEPYSSSTAGVYVGELVVNTTSGGKPLPGVPVNITANGGLEEVRSDEEGTLSVLLPGGNYTVSALGSGTLATTTATVLRDKVTYLSVDLRPSYPLMTYGLVALAGIAVVANFLVWGSYNKNRKISNDLRN